MDENGQPLSRKFAETEAYSVLFMELATDDAKAAEFVNGIIPPDVAEKAAALPDEQKLKLLENRIPAPTNN